MLASSSAVTSGTATPGVNQPRMCEGATASISASMSSVSAPKARPAQPPAPALCKRFLIDPGLLAHDGSVPLGHGSPQHHVVYCALAGRPGPMSGVYERSITVVTGHAVVTEASVRVGHRRIVSDAKTAARMALTCGNTEL